MRVTFESQESVDYRSESRPKQVFVTARLGNWPYEPGADVNIYATGTWKTAPARSEPIWSVSWDNSDDPHVAGWIAGPRDQTYKEAKAFATAKCRELTERRNK